jgi:hypothetical protein
MIYNESTHFDQWAQNIASHIPRFAKTIPTDVTDFLKYINHRTGAAFIAFAAYTNEDGQQTYARYDYDLFCKIIALK